MAGVLLHPTSLPGAGGLGSEARRFVDFLVEAGFSAWQMLPVGPVGPGNSPYAARSAFACEPMLISLESLASDGLLERWRDAAPPGDPSRLAYDASREFREPFLRTAFAEFMSGGGAVRLEEFGAGRNWLRPYAAFASLRHLSGQQWWDWPERFQQPHGVPLQHDTALANEVLYREFLQWCLDRQWRALREYAHQRGVSLYGDVPFFVDLDSADVWANQRWFKLNSVGRPEVVAGVPPDAFSTIGQHWGNPHYDWPAMRRDGYFWWVARLQRTFELFDAARIDHFRGFESAWEIPAGGETASHGRWEPGPGRDLFEALERQLGRMPILVEDLGIITDEVRNLRNGLGYPGVAVLQFAFGDGDANPHLPHNHVANQVVFTGTHDNNTTRGWYEQSPEWVTDHVRRYLSVDGSNAVNDLIRCAYRSPAATAIVPMQDVLGLGSEARMNVPGTAKGNWEWRFTWDQLPAGRARWFADLAAESERNAVRAHAK